MLVIQQLPEGRKTNPVRKDELQQQQQQGFDQASKTTGENHDQLQKRKSSQKR
jgi:hypothetical protein